MPRATSTAPRRREAPTEGERFSNCRRNQGEAGERRASLTLAPQVATPTVPTAPWSSISRVISTPQRISAGFSPEARLLNCCPRRVGGLPQKGFLNSGAPNKGSILTGGLPPGPLALTLRDTKGGCP